jgi:outer membrane protein
VLEVKQTRFYRLMLRISATLVGVMILESVGAAEAGETSAAGKMELGVALVGQIAADYRGSGHYRPYALPLPYLLYQGPIIKADRDGVRGDFWSGGRLEFNVSVDGSLNGNSDNNKARSGMPELESAMEFGPSLNIRLSGESLREGWSLRLPVRAVITISGDGLDHIGNVFSPRVTWRKPDVYAGWRASLSAGVMFADREYHSYFYDVAEPYVTQERPFYRASGGYSGGFMRVGLYRPWRDWRFGVSLRYDYLGGAEFIDSPLVETRHYGSISVGLMRTLWRSE